ncbi:hypothetical protein BDM02DRAFT_2810825 [Thelephora ganbajun]|uniref:Uncharacterized protein n=1 Tax=Thelephora ganbajun TaxID=370292 RepID=A0ACB6ZC58_THEGA|nr:hypothetical protein BDM02DRAFT_2810825 [Thelephora ganbajun]
MLPVYWLNGLAGTGKSTIAQTIAERTFADGRLGASFFCSRDFKDRSGLHYIFPTLAFQLAQKYPKFRSTLVRLLHSNPEIVNESLYYQMETLIVEPLSSLNISTVIVIDALDECVDEDPQSAILSVMGRLVESIPGVKFFITGRPEPRIQSGFRLGLLRPSTDVFVLHEVEPSVINMDIRLFLADGLSKLAKRRGIKQDNWPTDEHLNLLCERAGSLFVYAVATLKFLDHKFVLPSKQLDIIIRAPGSTVHEGKARFRPSTTLDSLYLTTFQSAFDEMGAEDDEKVQSVISTVVLAVNPLPPSAIATLVDLEKEEAMDLLRMIQSLLKLSEDPDYPVLPFHKSFPDFITNPLRCPDKRFHISPRTGHLNLALNCLKLMNYSLEQNLLSLPNYALNSEVKDLESRINNHISIALKYACQSWHNHLTEVRGDITTIIPALQNFLQVGFLAWLEVLSAIGAARDAIVALENLIPWLQEVRDHQLLNTARDYFQFATNFFEVINVSATHIYHSALELSPLLSIVRKVYYSQRPHPLPKVVTGIPDSWDPSTAISTKHPYYLSSTWSPSSQFIAVVAKEAVEIWDALTLKLLSTLRSTHATTTLGHGLSYSPDGQSLAGCSNTAIIVWDIQTGGEAKTIECGVTETGLELVWSLDGKTIGAFSPQKLEPLTVYVYDVVSGTSLPPCTLQSKTRPYIWAHDKSFRIATTSLWDSRSCRISIFEVGLVPTEIESFPLQFQSGLGVFSPATYRISVASSFTRDNTHSPEFLILDIQNSEILLKEIGSYWHLSFSDDGSLFAAFTGNHLLVWMYTSNHYTRWREFQQTPTPLYFSPTSLSILGCAGPLLYILHLGNSPAAPAAPAIEPVITTHSQQLDAFSPNGTYIATTYHGKSTITITNLHSQNPSPSQFIDTELEISAMVLTGRVLLVKGSDVVVAWLLTEEGVVDGIVGNTRADHNDSLWNISLQALANHWARLLGQRGGSDENGQLEFSVEDEIAAIKLNESIICVYHTETGEILKSVRTPLHLRATWYRFQDECNLYHSNLCKHHRPLECDWPVSQTTLQEGWVKDPDGKHRLWLHGHWRSAGNHVDWLHNAATLRLRNSSELVVIKF